MATADISSSFIVRVQQQAAAAEAINVANPGRTFRVEQVCIKWLGLNANPATSTVQVSRIRSGAATDLFSAAIAGSRTSVPVQLPDASSMNAVFLVPDTASAFRVTDDIRVTTVDAATQIEVDLHCIGNPSQSLVVT